MGWRTTLSMSERLVLPRSSTCWKAAAYSTNWPMRGEVIHQRASELVCGPRSAKLTLSHLGETVWRPTWELTNLKGTIKPLVLSTCGCAEGRVTALHVPV